MMRFADQSYNLRIELDTKHCSLSPPALEKMEAALAPLRQPVSTFPVSDLYITVNHHPTPDDYHVRVSLVLPKRTLFTGERDINPVSAFSRCVRKLVGKLEAYKENLSAKPERVKAEEGTLQEVVPATEPNATLLRDSVAEGDYAAFRRATYVYEEGVRKRAGRWVQRDPNFEDRLGIAFTIDDLIEEVFLNAFEQFDRWPDELRFGQWLEHLIDPSMQALLQDPEAERQNIDAVRAYQEVSGEGG